MGVCMLAFGYAGESGSMNPWAGFALGMCGWAFILFEIFAGGSAQAPSDKNVSEAVKQSFNNMRIIVSLGWAIYPAGYFLGQINDSASAAQALNVTYNIADFVNKIAFVLACWSCAKADTEAALIHVGKLTTLQKKAVEAQNFVEAQRLKNEIAKTVC